MLILIVFLIVVVVGTIAFRLSRQDRKEERIQEAFHRTLEHIRNLPEKRWTKK